MRDPGRLHVVDVALQVAELTYAVTSRFPAAERPGLVAQMRRAAVSIGSNIAEGCGRSTDKQFLAFLQIAMGSACELEFQCQLATRLRLATGAELHELRKSVELLKRMLAKFTIHVREL